MRTDLAKEARRAFPDIDGIIEETITKDEWELIRITVESKEASERLDKPMGRYSSVSMPHGTLMNRGAIRRCADFTEQELRTLLPESGEILVIGLGNRHITADALGPKTVEEILVTRHLLEQHLAEFPKDIRLVASFCTGVYGVTGIETIEIVSALAQKLRPAAVLMVDSLAAGESAHLGTVVQMNDTGISPGAGIGNFQTSLNEETLGVPVIAMGIPLVIGTETVLREATGEKEFSKRENPFVHYSVTPKEIDLLVQNAALLLSETINLALHGKHYSILQNLLK